MTLTMPAARGPAQRQGERPAEWRDLITSITVLRVRRAHGPSPLPTAAGPAPRPNELGFPVACLPFVDRLGPARAPVNRAANEDWKAVQPAAASCPPFLVRMI